MTKPIGIHPLNNKIFEYRDKPVVLLCATEHYGAVMNRPFDFGEYLKYCHNTGQNYTRLFLLFRELQTPINPHSTCKPESPDYVAPYMRTGPGNSTDGLPKYDLDKWNPEYFERLHNFMSLAEKYGVIVEVTLFSDSYTNELQSLLPFGNNSNINGVGDENFETYMSTKNIKIFEHQKKFAKKIVSEINKYTNFFYEICNEPLSFNPELVTTQEVNEWQKELIKLIRSLEKDMPLQHLVAITESWEFSKDKVLTVGTDRSFNELDADIVNVHPLPNVVYGGKTYDLGLFMSKSLKLQELKDYCLDTWHEYKILNIDEDNIASRSMDYEGWTIHRKRAWTTVFNGAHYDYIDFSIGIHCPTGTPDSQKYLHKWYKNIRDFTSNVDFVSGAPLLDIVSNCPSEVLESVYGTVGEQYNLYLADKRELTEPGYGEIISGEIELDIQKGEYSISYYSPEHGTVLSQSTSSGGKIKLSLPQFFHDLVIQLNKI